jgi:hypothetical protein
MERIAEIIEAIEDAGYEDFPKEAWSELEDLIESRTIYERKFRALAISKK